MKALLVKGDSVCARELRGRLESIADMPLSLETSPSLDAALASLNSSNYDLVIWALASLEGAATEQFGVFCRQMYPAPVVVAAFGNGKVRPSDLLRLGAHDCQVIGRFSDAEWTGFIEHCLARGQAVVCHEAARPYCSIVENQTDLICRFSPDGKLSFINQAYCRYFKKTREELLGGNFFDHVSPQDHDSLYSQLKELDQQAPIAKIELKSTETNLGARWQRWVITALFGDGGAITDIQGVGVDINERKRVDLALLTAEANLRQLFLSNADGMVVTDTKGQVLFVNPAAETLLGQSGFDLVGQPLAFPVVPGERSELRLAQPHGEVIAEMRVVHTRWQGRNAYLSSLRDITELVDLQERLRSLSLVDDLTLTYNRRGFVTLATQQLKTANRMHRRLLLFFIDLDDLKRINDTHGHPQGDRALKETAMILKATFRESDIVGRVGGDEFAVLAMEADAEGTEVVFERLVQNVTDWNSDAARPYQISLSTGLAAYEPDRPCTLEELIQLADAEMYKRKKAKK